MGVVILSMIIHTSNIPSVAKCQKPRKYLLLSAAVFLVAAILLGTSACKEEKPEGDTTVYQESYPGEWEQRFGMIRSSYNQFWNANKDRADLNEEDKRLVKMVRSMSLDDETGKVRIGIFASHETADYINEITNGQGIDSALGEKQFRRKILKDTRYREFMDDIKLFREKIIDSDAIIFIPAPKSY